MVWWTLALIPVGLVVSALLCIVLERLSQRVGAIDTPAIRGQIKDEHRTVPNTGGIAIFAGVVCPAGLVLTLAWLAPNLILDIASPVSEHLEGLRSRAVEAVALLAGLGAVHALGLLDDRKPLAWQLKLAVLLGAAALPPLLGGTRLLTLLDPHAGGIWLSVGITTLWIALIANAMNFMDNMDGVSGGTGAVASACLLAATLLSGQWFVAGLLALLLGALLGFLWRNKPPATLFMGDGGSLVVGYLLGYLTVRATFAVSGPEGLESAQALGPAWYGVFVPLAVLAVPLYDLLSVTAVRLSQGKSPFVGDLQHLSHRLVKRGLSKPAAAAVLAGATGVTGLSGVILPSLEPWAAVVAGAQVLMLLGVLAVFEYASADRSSG
ncbi:MAG: MraY family glycosyltransferase [Planctomycetota bacterium]